MSEQETDFKPAPKRPTETPSTPQTEAQIDPKIISPQTEAQTGQNTATSAELPSESPGETRSGRSGSATAVGAVLGGAGAGVLVNNHLSSNLANFAMTKGQGTDSLSKHYQKTWAEVTQGKNPPRQKQAAAQRETLKKMGFKETLFEEADAISKKTGSAAADAKGFRKAAGTGWGFKNMSMKGKGAVVGTVVAAATVSGGILGSIFGGRHASKVEADRQLTTLTDPSQVR